MSEVRSTVSFWRKKIQGKRKQRGWRGIWGGEGKKRRRTVVRDDFTISTIQLKIKNSKEKKKNYKTKKSSANQ